jgi:hypothetical protein
VFFFSWLAFGQAFKNDRFEEEEERKRLKN